MVSKAFGEGPGAFWGRSWVFWGRSDFEAGTFPSDCALQGALGQYQWGRYPAKKPTFPILPGDLPQNTGGPSPLNGSKEILEHLRGNQ